MRTTLGLIVGNRGFFPAHLAQSGRAEVLRVLAEEGIDVVALSPEDTTYGSVVSLSDSQRCADLFKQHKEEIDGVLVTLPNFGEERAIANALRWSGLDVPVLVQAFPDELDKLSVADRRDSFCGKMSTCNNLSQYGIPYSLTTLHTVAPDSEGFRQDLQRFGATCRVVKGLRNARIGVIGARPAAFNTVRFSEKLFEFAGISVEPIDLSEIIGQIERLGDQDTRVQTKRDEIAAYIRTEGVPAAALLKMAKLGTVVEEWINANRLDGAAVQCWTSMEEYFGIVPCAVMSMLTDNLVPSACETDAGGLLGMYAMQLASGRPSALVDWNNNYDDDPDKCILFHCSNWPKAMFESPKMDFQEIIAGTVGKENTYGTVVGRAKPGPFTYCRVSTDDLRGEITSYVGQGEFTDDPASSFGGIAVAYIPDLQDLLRYICEMGFEHHVAVNPSQVGAAVAEALDTYMGWEVYNHDA